MRYLILAALSALALSTVSASPSVAQAQSTPTYGQSGTQLNQGSNAQSDAIEAERQRALEEMDQMLTRERQVMMNDVDQWINGMREQMTRVINERFRAAHQAQLDR